MRRRIAHLVALVLIMASMPVVGLGLPGGRADAAPPPEFHYVPMSDGIEIAVQVRYPDDYMAGQLYPALLNIDGYGGAGDDGFGFEYPGYVYVSASVRGTGCSGGFLDLFSHRSAYDGHELIDDWLPTQSWFNGDAGIVGHSYAGLTGFLVAATNPANLRAIRVSGLIDDFYRGILYPGGVPNPGFPVLWGAGLRPLTEHSQNLDNITTDPHCLTNFLQHVRTLTEAARTAIDIYTNPMAYSDSWAIERGLMNRISGISKPIQMFQQYQDEQTGPRGANVLWEHIPAGVPKRLVVSTGRHNPSDPTREGQDWLDCWILHHGEMSATTTQGRSCADVLDPQQRVHAYFESMGADRNAPYVSSDWPLPETVWTRYYLRADRTLSTDVSGGDGKRTYLSTGIGRQLTLDVGGLVPLPFNLGRLLYPLNLPDRVEWTLPFNQTTAVAGPVVLSLWAAALMPDVDFFVEVLDRNLATGETTFVQRGLLRASLRENDPVRSRDYRPERPYTQSRPLMPGQPYQFDIEVYPLGHVFRAGHAMVLQVHAPPPVDPISTFLALPNLPGLVTILQHAGHRSSILLPVMPTLPPIAAAAPACGQVEGEICLVK